MPDGTSRLSHRGRTLTPLHGTSTFAEYTVRARDRARPRSAPTRRFDKAASSAVASPPASARAEHRPRPFRCHRSPSPSATFGTLRRRSRAPSWRAMHFFGVEVDADDLRWAPRQTAPFGSRRVRCRRGRRRDRGTGWTPGGVQHRADARGDATGEEADLVGAASGRILASAISGTTCIRRTSTVPLWCSVRPGAKPARTVRHETLALPLPGAPRTGSSSR